VSRETTEANALARQAAQQWRDHKRHCSQCSIEAHRRNWAGLCPAGREAWRDNREAQEALTENRRLDRLPIAGQEPMFT
jgi:hypothetical protein